MCFGNGAHQTEAEPMSRGRASGFEPNEALLHPRPVGFRDSRAIIPYNQCHAASRAPGAKLNQGATWRMAERIFDKVDNGLSEQFSVARNNQAPIDGAVQITSTFAGNKREGFDQIGG